MPSTASIAAAGKRSSKPSASHRHHAAASDAGNAYAVTTTTPWPCPPAHMQPFTQLFAHFASTSIMTLLVLFSFVEDVSKWLHSLIFPPAVARSNGPAMQVKSVKSKPGPGPGPSRRSTHLRIRKIESEEEEDGSSSTAINDSSDDPEECDADLELETVGTSSSQTKKGSSGGGSVLSAFIPKSLRSRRVIRDYCAHAGYCCDTFETITDDGFILFIHRVASHDRKPARKGPVILMHGLFQSSGVWVTNGMHSLAFYLVDQGFDVWMGNNRTCIEQHVSLSPSHTDFWNWSLDELARYDFPAHLDLVRRETGYDKVAFVGHSQGNAQAFLSMLQNPSVSSKISVFVALAPAVYIGSLLESFPVCLLMDCPSDLFRFLFGVKAFLPIMTFVQKYFQPYIFATLAYHMFHYLFGWTDTNWDPRNKTSYFQFTPRPQSSKAIHHWSQMGSAGIIKPFESNPSNPRTTKKTHPPVFDVSCIKCPLALYYGSKDTIIDGPALHKRCEEGGVNLVAAEIVEGYEHMDCLWSMDAKEKVWKSMVKLLDRVGV
ncbi:hypothetical protein HDU67_006880 [Dinochytrium kinnereticum]|nr:hypothetical protein HDU67_006880 [Dinochytrium kinnereticum]